MSMVTSCPACTTTFRVTHEQLMRRQGKVRCGECRSVFDAFKTLASLPEGPGTEDSELRTDEAAAAPAPPSPQQGSLDIEGAGSAASLALTGVAAATSAEQARSRTIWTVAVVVLALLLGLQLAYSLRDPMSAAFPSSRPLFEALCALSGCTVALPRHTEQLAIESSDLKADAARPNVVVLTAALRNRGNGVLAHPAIELTFTDSQDQALARRIFLPSDYLQDMQDVRRGMPAFGEVNVRIELDTGALKPSGYRIFLFYP
jgi:predicted Zn finger-like uncharacterized protein